MEMNKLPILLLMLLSITSSCSCFNITKILDKEDDFSTFNDHLTETKLADNINRRSTITILAVDNSAMGGLGGDSRVAKAVMSVHVILDYYDKEKLSKLAKNNKSATLTTLFQTSGNAKKQQGFVRVTVEDGEVLFGSASKGGSLNSKLVGSVMSQPYNISVLQVSSIIDIPDINASPAPYMAPPPRKMKGPSPSDDDAADGPSDDTADGPDSDDAAGSPDMEEEDSPSPSPGPSKHRSPPKPDGDDSDSPSPSPSPSPTEGPGKGSDARATVASGGVLAVGLVSVLVALLF